MTNRPSAAPLRDISRVARPSGSAPGGTALFDEQVVPRYLLLFGERMLAMIAEGPDARVCHLGAGRGTRIAICSQSSRARTRTAATRPSTRLPAPVGTPPRAGLGLAGLPRRRWRCAAPVPERRLLPRLHAPPAGGPRGAPAHARRARVSSRRAVRRSWRCRSAVVRDCHFLRECALKNELSELTNAVEAAAQLRPTDEMFAKELASVGFEFVDVDVRPADRLRRRHGLLRGPGDALLLLLPEFRVNLAMDTTSRSRSPTSGAD